MWAELSEIQSSLEEGKSLSDIIDYTSFPVADKFLVNHQLTYNGQSLDTTALWTCDYTGVCWVGDGDFPGDGTWSEYENPDQFSEHISVFAEYSACTNPQEGE